jgi:predicted CxxxxCH...CXXCH cytochrome family protein
MLAAATSVACVAACAIDRDDAPGGGSAIHPAGIADPTSPDFHGTLLRARRWSPMLDANDTDACGRCHAGVPATPSGVTSSAPGATACTECHAEPTGPLACNTCHADPPTSGAHAAHLARSAASAKGFTCTTCHPVPNAGKSEMSGAHGNGSVDIVFDPAVVKPEASYDPTTQACAVSCHDQGGARARPTWTKAAAMTCNDCHRAPPPAHFPGACSECHVEVNAAGTSLTGGPLHMNGHVDLGDGSGTCAACHGGKGDPWPSTGAHAAHETPVLTSSIACATCHVVPSEVLAPGHLDGVAEITFAGRALDRGAHPTWSGGSCAAVACHGAGLGDAPAVVPRWDDPTHVAGACGACHGTPPTQHTPSTSCEDSNCHGSEVSRAADGTLSITLAGRALHIDGKIESGP